MEYLIDYRKNIYSENGEDGIIERIFSDTKTETKLCCEFGAWDGIWASNCRNLIIKHNWKGIMIEGDPLRYKDLLNTYDSQQNVRCLNNYIDTQKNSLNNLLTENEKANLDFLSIDIDGLDYEIFEDIKFSPKVICVEVNTGHDPTNNKVIPRNIAKDNVGQPLNYFIRIANSKDYKLVCFTGNAFFIRNDILQTSNINAITPKTAYIQHLKHAETHVKEHLFFVNKGKVNPYYEFNNPYLDRKGLNLSIGQILKKTLSINNAKLNHKLITRKIKGLKNIIKYIITKILSTNI